MLCVFFFSVIEAKWKSNLENDLYWLWPWNIKMSKSTWENANCKFPLQNKGGDVIEWGGLEFSWSVPSCHVTIVVSNDASCRGMGYIQATA
jgi:hypothetical protein